ncbi:hypothetical protein RFI_22435 [Reticulomyxa filosa]|uniref:Uncharacterized protein n=1 Tax=Reticulomyxa filosa TaxID=46433 RepID=X6MLR1_RETFI|nr:hypothetical protein RFI_22435 [Reticulomyxa filosa]|eukprot:ETO14933.1 hypothetical protein RFI_22435 [Reticulomyxa filosa]
MLKMKITVLLLYSYVHICRLSIVFVSTFRCVATYEKVEKKNISMSKLPIPTEATCTPITNIWPFLPFMVGANVNGDNSQMLRLPIFPLTIAQANCPGAPSTNNCNNSVTTNNNMNKIKIKEDEEDESKKKQAEQFAGKIYEQKFEEHQQTTSVVDTPKKRSLSTMKMEERTEPVLERENALPKSVTKYHAHKVESTIIKKKKKKKN